MIYRVQVTKRVKGNVFYEPEHVFYFATLVEATDCFNSKSKVFADGYWVTLDKARTWTRIKDHD